MSEHFQPMLFDETESRLTPSAVGSPARTSAWREKALGSTALARDYGANTPDLLASFDRDTSSWRTSQLWLEGGLTEFSETWPRSGLMRNGIAYRLPPLAPLTDEIGSGLWPTPRAEDQQTGAHRGKPDTLTAAARLWPTPHGMCSPNKRRAGPSGNELGRAVNQSLWATPTALDWRSAKRIKIDNRSMRRRQLNEQVEAFPTPTANRRSGLQSHGHNVVTGSLNPTWVEWLMGFPLEWTVLEASETPSSRRYRK
jgi:DNA (cytosine-5)-methyltransferase 1